MLNRKDVEEFKRKTNEVEKHYENWNQKKTIVNYVKWLQKIYENFGG